MPQNLLIATRNSKKKRELETILGDWDVNLLTLDNIEEMPEIEEDGATFAENAIKKAQIISALSGFITLADDSGLEVDALGGAPGIFSARFSGIDADDEKNNHKLLALMQNLSEVNRTARFVCLIAIATPEGIVQTVEGVCKGKIDITRRGQGGFGYDPLFIPSGFNKTFAELSDEEKNEISHRGKALQEAKPLLQRILGVEGVM
ncbi:MAG: non-canonical purine NTP pyrophosphatase [Firmicutes bacterium HGW-Firmicutes-15]|nr:MAG: non-canonical purine NTP pyrophosphatase [Firmicutes bacterium HGW-Firmicutes-15]